MVGNHSQEIDEAAGLLLGRYDQLVHQRTQGQIIAAIGVSLKPGGFREYHRLFRSCKLSHNGPDIVTYEPGCAARHHEKDVCIHDLKCGPDLLPQAVLAPEDHMPFQGVGGWSGKSAGIADVLIAVGYVLTEGESESAARPGMNYRNGSMKQADQAQGPAQGTGGSGLLREAHWPSPSTMYLKGFSEYQLSL